MKINFGKNFKENNKNTQIKASNGQKFCKKKLALKQLMGSQQKVRRQCQKILRK